MGIILVDVHNNFRSLRILISKGRINPYLEIIADIKFGYKILKPESRLSLQSHSGIK